MTSKPITVRSGEAPEIEAFLAERIYEYNSQATGYYDGESFSASHVNDAGGIEAGIFGFTWGGCCFVSYLWVCEGMRGKGLGSALLEACERYAGTKKCSVVLLSSHTFQGPEFYRQRGYEAVARIEDYPVGHADIFLAKRLVTKDRL